MTTKRRFNRDTLAQIRDAKILGIRAGTEGHRFIGVWVVVVDGRVFIRAYYLRPRSWFRTFLEEPRGAIQVGKREIPVRAVNTRSERIKDAVDRAYAAKYTTPASRKYVRGFKTARRRDTTTELIPL